MEWSGVRGMAGAGAEWMGWGRVRGMAGPEREVGDRNDWKRIPTSLCMRVPTLTVVFACPLPVLPHLLLQGVPTPQGVHPVSRLAACCCRHAAVRHTGSDGCSRPHSSAPGRSSSGSGCCCCG